MNTKQINGITENCLFVNEERAMAAEAELKELVRVWEGKMNKDMLKKVHFIARCLEHMKLSLRMERRRTKWD